MREKITQKEKIHEFIKLSGGSGVITADVIRYGIDSYIGNPDRRLRELQEMGEVVGVTEKQGYKRWFDKDAINERLLF